MMNELNLPLDWANAAFADVVVSFSNGIGGDQNKEGNGIPVSRIETIADQSFNFNKVGYLADYDSAKIDKYRLNHGDILFSHINSPIHLGKTAIFEDKKTLYHGINLLRIVVNREIIYPEIFNYFCKLTRFQGLFAMRAQHAVNQSSINQKKLGEFEIPIAPLPEQKRIADKLDTVLARVDACREHLNRVPLILKRFRQSVLAAATSGQLTIDWREVKVDADLPHGWGQNRLKDLSERVSVGHVGETSKHYTSQDSGIPFLRSQNVRPGKLSTDGLNYITKAFHESLKKSQLKRGDLLVVRVGANRGDSCVLPLGLFDEVNCANIVFARPKQSLLHPGYLGIYFQAPICQSMMLEESVGGAQGVINTGVVGNIFVNVPPLGEQHEIVRRVETLFAFADRLEARLATARAATDRLTPALLAKAFRGELVPQDPNDEPAAELLKRLAATRTATSDKPRRGRAAKVEKRPSGHPSQVGDS